MKINCKCPMCGGNESMVIGFDSYTIALKCDYCGTDWSSTDDSLIDCYRIKYNLERREREFEEKIREKEILAQMKAKRERQEEEHRREIAEYNEYVTSHNNQVRKSIKKAKIRKGLLIPRMIIYAIIAHLFALISIAVEEDAPIVILGIFAVLFIIALIKIIKLSKRISYLRHNFVS